jgi:hypothetical protein
VNLIVCVASCIYTVLEGEMYQLSHLLTDQKGIMTSMLERSLFGDSSKLRLLMKRSTRGRGRFTSR